MALVEGEESAAETHGTRPIALVLWRGYVIGDEEIEQRRTTLLAQGKLKPKTIEREYRAAKAREEKLLQAGRDWYERTGLAPLRLQSEQADDAADVSNETLARTKPTTPAGAAALIPYVLSEAEELGDSEWHRVALAIAADALNSM